MLSIEKKKKKRKKKEIFIAKKCKKADVSSKYK